MQNHPLTPMIDADIRRWLKPQSEFEVGHVAALDVLAGSAAIKSALQKQHEAGKRLIVIDALRDEDLMQIGLAAEQLPLITGGSGVALGLPANFARRGLINTKPALWEGQPGKCAILSGSCSTATRAQVALHAESHPVFEIVAAEVIDGRLQADTLVEWYLKARGLPLAYSSADPEVVLEVQKKYGRERAATALESFFANVARQLVARGVTRIITAGGETSGAVVEALQLNSLLIGPEIDPGVPALRAAPDLVIALKSGNFGEPNFFSKAAAVLAGES